MTIDKKFSRHLPQGIQDMCIEDNSRLKLVKGCVKIDDSTTELYYKGYQIDIDRTRPSYDRYSARVNRHTIDGRLTEVKSRIDEVAA
jgi:hypothetical protein